MRAIRDYSIASLLGALLLPCPDAALCQTTVKELPLDVRIELPKANYAIGEAITIVVSSNRDCYFLMFTIDPSGKVEIHDPVTSGAYMGHPLLRAGERRQIPQPDAPGRAIITPPAGRYEIGAVCGRDELAKLGLTLSELKDPATGGRRSFEFHLEKKTERLDRDALTRTVSTYNVQK
jgi:hypothetical protein